MHGRDDIKLCLYNTRDKSRRHLSVTTLSCNVGKYSSLPAGTLSSFQRHVHTSAFSRTCISTNSVTTNWRPSRNSVVPRFESQSTCLDTSSVAMFQCALRSLSVSATCHHREIHKAYFLLPPPPRNAKCSLICIIR